MVTGVKKRFGKQKSKNGTGSKLRERPLRGGFTPRRDKGASLKDLKKKKKKGLGCSKKQGGCERMTGKNILSKSAQRGFGQKGSQVGPRN